MGMLIRLCQALIALTLATDTIAIPISPSKRQTWTSVWAHDLTDLGCRTIILIFARETIGPGNMVRTLNKSTFYEYATLHIIFICDFGD